MFDIREPKPADGPAVTALIRGCPPLDENSRYCHLLQCGHFADTSALALSIAGNGCLAGWVSGYRLPRKPNVLFVWQVAVASRFRGQRLGQRLILHILSRPRNSGVDTIHTSVTLANRASARMFRHLADELCAPLEERVLFDRHTHLAGDQDSEFLLTIGPFASAPTQ